MDSAHLIVGLGNPGSKYRGTRHNIGFLAVDELARRGGVSLREERKFEARVGDGTVRGKRTWLCQPLTYMNASGKAVRALTEYYRVPLERLLVIVDDADLPFGELRLRPSGGTGGHHGLESIEEMLGSDGYARLRLGIGRGAGLREISGHVLGRFSESDRERLEAVLGRAADQVECWLDAGIQKAMNNFNGMIDHPEQKGTSQ
jgi:PTH1 family peptidyl-tRNA hydrolase